MKRLLPVVIASLFAVPALAAGTVSDTDDPLFTTMDQINLNELKWKKRPVVVFADSVDDPAFITQMDFLRADEKELMDRDVVVIVDTEPDVRSDLRLKMRPRGFMLVLVGKDGDVKLRKPFPWSVREISRSIDKMPIRKREIQEAKTAD
jgi:hypothetical protein